MTHTSVTSGDMMLKKIFFYNLVAGPLLLTIIAVDVLNAIFH